MPASCDGAEPAIGPPIGGKERVERFWFSKIVRTVSEIRDLPVSRNESAR